MEIVLAILTGTLFGFALNRVGATNPNYVINMLRLKNTHLMKVILFAIGLSSILLFLDIAAGIVDISHLSIKTSYIGVIVGGAILGIGFAISGYCPGTGLTAAATGRKDAWVFVAGGLLGAFAYMLTYAHLEGTFLMNKIMDGDVMLANVGAEKYTSLITSVPGLVVALVLGIAFMVVAYKLPKTILNMKEHKD